MNGNPLLFISDQELRKMSSLTNLLDYKINFLSDLPKTDLGSLFQALERNDASATRELFNSLPMEMQSRIESRLKQEPNRDPADYIFFK